jgi:hypothetical protein
MKTKSTLYSLIIAAMMINAVGQAQSRDDWSNGGTTRSHDDRDRDNNNTDNRDNNWNNNNNRDDRYQNRDRHSNYGYNSRQNSQRRNAVVYHYNRPRYIYYRDYDVYYDCRNNSYISHNGRRWMVSQTPPRNYRHINWRSLRGYEVNYWDDDFPVYLERRRPGIGNEYRGW